MGGRGDRVKNDQIMKLTFFTPLSPKGPRGVNKITREPILCTNKALTKNFCFAPTLTSSFVGYFFVPGPLSSLKSLSWDIFEHTDSIGRF